MKLILPTVEHLQTPEPGEVECDEGGCRVMRKGKVTVPEAHKEIRPGVYLSRVTNDWLPLPEVFVKQLGWTEGTELELVPIMNEQVIIRKKDALKDSK